MNTILQKCITELNKETPNVEKVIGMLETIIELGSAVVVQKVETPAAQVVTATPGFTAAPQATALSTEKPPAHPIHGTLTAETPAERTARLGRHKVPPAFLGSTDRMFLDPSKVEGKTDVTPHH